MKKNLITILILLSCLTIQAQTKYYIDPAGNDATGNGSAGNPWESLYKACNTVTTAGDTIYINPGTYTETNACNLAVGVSIKGAGLPSHVKSQYKASWPGDYANDASISLVSSTDNTNGNQSISNILLDGDNLTANSAILVKRRGNVSIHDITIKDFYINGIGYMGGVNGYDKPTVLAEGNKLYNAILDNCTDTAETWVGGGLIYTHGQKNLEIHDCILSDTSRPDMANGDIVVGGRWGLGFKYYNNTSYKPSNGYHGWNFHLEIPWESAGCEIYNNTFYGGDQGIDVGGNTDYDYSYAFKYKIYNNHFEDYSPTMAGSNGKCSVCIEGEHVKNVYVHNNTFKNVGMPLVITDGTAPGVATHDSNIVFHNNVSIGTGIFNASSYQNLIEIQKDFSGGSIRGLKIINNTIIPNSLVKSSAIGIINHNGSTMDDILIANNIFTDGENGTWLSVDNASSSIDSLRIHNNILYNNPNSNNPTFYGNTVTNYVNALNINSDPKFVSSTDVRLQADSPARGAAFDYGYGLDIGGIQYESVLPVDIIQFKIRKKFINQ